MRGINDRAWALAGTLLLGLPLISGCGDAEQDKTEPVDTAKDTGAATTGGKPKAQPYSQSAMESKLEDVLAPSVGPPPAGLPKPSTPAPPKVTSAKCPSDVEPGAGTAFDCKLAGQQGLKGTVRVTLKSENLTPFSYKGKYGSSGVSTTISGTVR
jgi:hypothetical protein